MLLGDKLKAVSTGDSRRDVYYVSRFGRRLYTAEGAAGMGIYEIGADYRIKEVCRLAIPDRGVRQIVAPEPGQFALLHCGGARIDVADVRDPTRPRLVYHDSQVGLFYGDQLVDKIFAGRYLVAYWQRSGPAWYDISGDRPFLAGNTPDNSLFGWTDGACAFGDTLLITKLGRYSLLDPNEKRNVCDLPAYGPSGVRIAGRPSAAGNMLAISQRTFRRVSIFDVTDIARPCLRREWSLFGHPGACAFWNSRVVIPAGYQGLLLERPPVDLGKVNDDRQNAETHRSQTRIKP